MKFNHLEYLPYLLGIFLVFSIFIIRIRFKFFKWVRLNWFYKQSILERISFGLFILSIFLLLVSLLDLRGPSKKIKSMIPQQKTIILIDTSSSMLVEDVRPNRFNKALILARHFVKAAAGMQISIVLFSDYQKVFVPFTSDVDLLDGRISGLSTINITKGGSSISQALSEAVQYFKENSEEGSLSHGNILILSDAEDTTEGMDNKVPDNISVALIGIGTHKGGTIPLRDSRNIFYGNKQFNGTDVISKLDETFMKQMSGKIKNYKYWVASSFSLPTNEILDFFSKTHLKKFSSGDADIRPVLMEWILIPSLLLLALSYLLRFRKLLLACLCIISLNLYAQEGEEEEVKLTEKEQKLMEKLSVGKGTKDTKFELATEFLKNNHNDHAIMLFEEVLSDKILDQDLKSRINLGTAYLKKGELNLGLEVYESVTQYLKKNNIVAPDLEKTIKINTVLALNFDQQGGGKGKDQKQDQKNKEQSQNKDQEQDQDQDGSGDPNKNQPNKPKDNKDKKDNKDQKDGKKNDPKNNKDKPQQKENKDGEGDETEEQPKNPKLKVKVPAQLKQLMNEDRTLQERLLDTSTSDRMKARKVKDW
jgi:Ca-activated chloride channel family protein